MFVKVTLPVLLTLPEKVSNWPGETGCAGHDLVTWMPGVKTSEQVVLAELVTVRGVAVNWSVPWATSVAVLGLQGFNGTQLPLNEATWPRARLVGKSTVKAPLLTKFVTVTPTSVSLPQLVTVPVKVITPFSPTLPTHCTASWMQGIFTTVFTCWLPPPLLLTTFW